MTTFAQRVAHLETTIFSEINNYAALYDTVNLGQGKPDFDGPQSILQAAADSILSGVANQYAPGYGIRPLRESIADHAAVYYGLTIDPETGVVVTAGATEGIFSAIMSIVNPGDEVILLEPFFDTYLPVVEWAGGSPVFVPLRPPQWAFDRDELRAAFNDRTRALILNSPHNPTGRVFTRDELEFIAALCQQHDVIVISDEVYEHLTFDETPHIPIATLPGMFERTLTVSSAAKTFSVTGWKCGWVMGDPHLITGVWRLHQNVTFAVNHPAQHGIAHGLRLGDAYFDELKNMYRNKRQILLDALRQAGIRVHYQPEGAFYIMGDFRDIYDGDIREFAYWLIREHGIASIPPVTLFSDQHRHLAQGYVRFSYCKDDAILHEAAKRLAKVKA